MHITTRVGSTIRTLLRIVEETASLYAWCMAIGIVDHIEWNVISLFTCDKGTSVL